MKAGESAAIVGPSGCGKTTLLKVILGLLAPQAGEVLYGGIPVKHHAPCTMPMGYQTLGRGGGAGSEA